MCYARRIQHQSLNAVHLQTSFCLSNGCLPNPSRHSVGISDTELTSISVKRRYQVGIIERCGERRNQSCTVINVAIGLKHIIERKLILKLEGISKEDIGSNAVQRRLDGRQRYTFLCCRPLLIGRCAGLEVI